jgi:hypothetical protein
MTPEQTHLNEVFDKTSMFIVDPYGSPEVAYLGSKEPNTINFYYLKREYVITRTDFLEGDVCESTNTIEVVARNNKETVTLKVEPFVGVGLTA